MNAECICRICGHGLEDHDFVVVDSQVVEVVCLSVSNPCELVAFITSTYTERESEMTTESTIPTFMRDFNVDAISWSEARDGDYLLLRDPASRGMALADAFRIDGVAKIQPDGTMHAYTVKVQGSEDASNSVYRSARNRIFDSACWQVWRDFGAVITVDAELTEVRRLIVDTITAIDAILARGTAR
jgi:hypothetical protein